MDVKKLIRPDFPDIVWVTWNDPLYPDLMLEYLGKEADEEVIVHEC